MDPNGDGLAIFMPWVGERLHHPVGPFALAARLPAVPERLAGVDVQRVEAGRELAFQGVVDGPVSRQPGHARQRRRPYPDSIVRLAAGGGPSVPMVKVGFIHYMQLIRRKNCSKRGPYALRAGCQFLRH